MICSACHTGTVFARSLCQACYYRLRRNGTVARKNVSNKGRCSIEGCEEQSFAKNLCPKHYQKAQHPMRSAWRLLRSRNKKQYPKTWDRFEDFLADVGERPSDRHQLRRPDLEKPWSKENAQWREPIKVSGAVRDKEWLARYGRAWSRRKKYGISDADYDKMLSEQGGVCAICRNPETSRTQSGAIKEFAIDHDHKTLKVRGLLCAQCNKGLGHMDDSVETIRAAIAYLERHSKPGD